MAFVGQQIGLVPPELAGPHVKRLTAEQFADALAALTDVWPSLAAYYPSRGRGELRFDSGVMTSGQREVDVDVAGAALLTLDAFGLIDPAVESAVRAAVRAATG